MPFYKHPRMPVQAVFSQWGRKRWRSAGRDDSPGHLLCTWSLKPASPDLDFIRVPT